ncbi:hypothetical protein FRC16_005396, partial [Serendipita sp. 398]
MVFFSLLPLARSLACSGVALVLHLVWSIVAALDVSSTDTRRTSSHLEIAIYNLLIQLVSLCAITSILLFDSKSTSSKSHWFSHVLYETYLYVVLALCQFAGALAYSALSPKFECATSVGATCSPASRAILVGCWAIALLCKCTTALSSHACMHAFNDRLWYYANLTSDVGFSLWFTFLVVRTSQRDPTVWSSRFKSFDWDGSRRGSGTMSGHGHGQHDALISPASPLGLLAKGGGGGGGGEKKGISTIVMPTPPETAEIPTASSVSVPAPRKNSTWMMFPTRASRPRPRLESTPHLPIQNLPPPTPYTAVPASASAPAIGMATANATLTLQSQSPPPPLMSATSSIPPVPPLPLQYQYQPHQQQQQVQQVQQVQQMQYQQDGLLSPVHLSPVPQDVPEDISLSGTPAALRPVSLAQSLAQKQRQMIMSIKPLRLGLGRSGGRASIDKTMIGQPKAFVDPMGAATRRHHSFDDDYSSVAESKYMSMTMTAAEATFNHWWRPESSFAPG